MATKQTRLTPFGRKVRKRLIDKNMTQVELAALLGCNYTIPSDNRELQPVEKETVIEENYTIPSDANSASSDHRFR